MKPWTTCLALALALPGAVMAQDPDLARNLAATCATCHGVDGRSRGAMPSLHGLSAREIADAMAAFQRGERAATVMHQIAKGYSAEQIERVAGYLVSRRSAP